MAEWTYAMGLAATVAFAVTAVLAVSPKGIDVFGATVLGLITAVGGGTVRDLVLGVSVFWAADQTYLWVALVSSLAAFRLGALFTREGVNRLLLHLDALGAALFGIQAVNKVWNQSFALPLGPIMLGIVTAIGGGLIRDVLAGRKTLLMSRELYAIPVMLGCTLFVLVLEFLPDHKLAGAVAGFLLSFALRAAAIRWNLTVPGWLATEAKGE
jgi:uncharacterized membrane protein YeiH